MSRLNATLLLAVVLSSAAGSEAAPAASDPVRPRAVPPECAAHPEACCPPGATPLRLSSGDDTYFNTTANRCVLALGGRDTVSSPALDSTVVAGADDDVVAISAAGIHRLYGGDGRDTLYGGEGEEYVFGGPGDDVIFAGNGRNFVLPGPGADTVNTGTGADTIAIYDLCEVASGENLAAATGSDTLITPVPVSQLTARGVQLSGFENVVVQPNSCKSECVTKPNCSGHGSCGEGERPGETRCVCAPGFYGPDCSHDSLDACARSVPVPPPPVTREKQEQYQRDILKRCSTPELTDCEASVQAKVNFDYLTAAARVISETMTTSQHLAFLQDRERKLRRLRGDQPANCRIGTGDRDGDLIPDPIDRCPNSPELTPTTDDGCPDPTPPPIGPDIADVKKILIHVGVPADPRCVGASSPGVPEPLGAWRFPSDPSVGKALWITKSEDSTGCPTWYQLEAHLTGIPGTRVATFRSEADVDLPWIVKPQGAVQFNPRTTDGGARGLWASYSLFTESYRVRAVRGNGRRSAWSNWFVPGQEGCLAGACRDSQR